MCRYVTNKTACKSAQSGHRQRDRTDTGIDIDKSKSKSRSQSQKRNYILFLNRFGIYKKGSLSAAFYGGDEDDKSETVLSSDNVRLLALSLKLK